MERNTVSLTIERTFDEEQVFDICTEPDIFSRIAEDGRVTTDFAPDVESHCWLLLTVDHDVIGAYKLEPVNGCTLDIHAHVLPEFRARYAKASAFAVLRWFLDECPSKYVKITAQIPVIYPDVVNFTKYAGFQEEGINRQSYRKHGAIHDQVMLGITRDEVEAMLNGRH